MVAPGHLRADRRTYRCIDIAAADGKNNPVTSDAYEITLAHSGPACGEGREQRLAEQYGMGGIAATMVDDDNKPVPGMEYEITLPVGHSVAEGTLDDKGLARIEGIVSGNRKITFPSLDKDA